MAAELDKKAVKGGISLMVERIKRAAASLAGAGRLYKSIKYSVIGGFTGVAATGQAKLTILVSILKNLKISHLLSLVHLAKKVPQNFNTLM